MEQLSKLNIGMGAEEFTNLLETLEKKDFSFWKGRIVADKESNKYSLENLLQIFKALKETSNIEESQLEKLRLKLIDLYKPDNTSNKIKDLFYSILAPLKGGIARNNILGIAESKWKKVARVSLVTLTGALALGGIAFVGLKLLRSASPPQQPADTKLHDDCSVLSEMGIGEEDVKKYCTILVSSKTLPLLKSIKSKFDEKQEEVVKISLKLEKLNLEIKEIKGKSLGFRDPKVLDNQRDIIKKWKSSDMQKSRIEKENKALEQGQKFVVLHIANKNARNEACDNEACDNEAIDLAEEAVRLACLNEEQIPSEKEKLQKEGLKVLFSLYGRKDYDPKQELRLEMIFSDLNKIEGKNLAYLKDLILSSESKIDHAKEFILSAYQKTDLTEVQKNILDEVVTGSIFKDPKYLEAALTQASNLFKKRSDHVRAIKILSVILDKSFPELTEETKTKVLAIFKIVSLNDKIERKEDNKDEKKVKTEASLFLELFSPQKIKMTKEEHIILAEEYLKRNTSVMKNVAFDLLSNLLTLNSKKKGDFLTTEQTEKITHLIQQQLQSGLLPSNLKSISNVLKNFKTPHKFTISSRVLNDFVSYKDVAECRELANFMLIYIKSSDKEKVYKDVNKFADLLSDKSTPSYLFFSEITEMDKEKHALGLDIYLHLSTQVMPNEFWINLEKVFEKNLNQSINKLIKIANAIKNGRTTETTKAGIKEVSYKPSKTFTKALNTISGSR